MKRIILIIVFLLVISLITGHVVLSRQFEQQLDHYASQFSHHGRLTWDGISIRHTGKVSIRQMRFQPHDSRDRILLEELVLDAGGLGGLINLGRMLENNMLPTSLRIHVRSLDVPVNREIGAWVGTFNPGLPFASAGCGDFDPLQFYNLGDIGLVGLTINLHIDYRIVNQGEDLDLNTVVRASQLSESSIRLRLALDEPSRSIREVPQTLGRTRLLRASHTFTDLGLYPRLMAMCAEHTGQETDEYINHHINAWIQQWAEHGLEPGRLPLVAYRHFLLQPGTVAFTTEPETPPLLGEFDRTRFTRLVGQVPVQFSVEDGTPVDLVFGEVDPPPRAVIAPIAEVEEDTAAEVTGDADTGIVVGPVPQWRTISVAEIGEHIDFLANISTVDGTRFRGRILEVEDNAVYLSIQTRQGLLMRPITLRSIESVQVRQ